MRVLFLWSLLFIMSIRTFAQYDSLAIKNLVITPVSCDSTVIGVILSDDNAVKQSFIKYGFRKLATKSIWNPTPEDICTLESCLDSCFWKPILDVVLKHKKTLIDKVSSDDYFRQYIGLLDSNSVRRIYISYTNVKHPEMGDVLLNSCEKGFIRLFDGRYNFFYIILDFSTKEVKELKPNW
ncbi:MAG: hypothetical protein KKA07_17240 [Bacteroidetes bacterium]|nr:hypothetical protein [Bacteroidota bacterium]